MCFRSIWHKDIDYPATWQRVVGFLSPKESSVDSYLEGVYIGITGDPNITLKEFIDSTIQNLKETSSDFHLIESIPTTIAAGIPAYQLVYIEKGEKSLVVVTKKGNKVYHIMYRSKPEKYLKFLPLAEQMIASFEFLY